MFIPFDQVIPLWGLYPREVTCKQEKKKKKNFMHKDSYQLSKWTPNIGIANKLSI